MDGPLARRRHPAGRGRTRALALAAVLGLGAAVAVPASGQPRPVPVLTALSPAELPIGVRDATLTVSGRDFVRGSVVRLAGSDLRTTFVSSTLLTAMVTTFERGAEVRVVTPGPGGGTSNAVILVGFLGGPGTAVPVIGVSEGLQRLQTLAVAAVETRIRVRNVFSGLLQGAVSATTPFSCVSGCTYALGPGQGQDVVVRFAPGTAGIFEGLATFTGAGGAVSPLVGVALGAPASARVTLSETRFTTGQNLVVGLSVDNPPGNPALDLYVGVVLTDGVSVLFLSDGAALLGTGSLASPGAFPPGQPAPGGYRLEAPAYLQASLTPPAVAPGGYIVFAALVRPEAFLDGLIHPQDVLALDARSLVLEP